MRKIRVNIFGVIALFALIVSVAQAQNAQDDIELSKSIIQTQRKAIVANNMNLTEQESKQFWQVYGSYREEMKVVMDRAFDVIQKYAKDYNSDTLTDEKALILIKDWMAVLKKKLKIKEKYLSRFDKALPSKKVMRFFQVDSKLDAIVDAGIAKEIPLVD